MKFKAEVEQMELELLGNFTDLENSNPTTKKVKRGNTRQKGGGAVDNG